MNDVMLKSLWDGSATLRIVASANIPMGLTHFDMNNEKCGDPDKIGIGHCATNSERCRDLSGVEALRRKGLINCS